jgi:hypothetical protein
MFVVFANITAEGLNGQRLALICQEGLSKISRRNKRQLGKNLGLIDRNHLGVSQTTR